VSFEDYRQWDAVNISRLKPLRRSALECKWELDHPREETDALLMGCALHCAVFEPARFGSDFVVIPKFDRRTKDGKNQYAEAIATAQGKTLLNADQHESVSNMAKALQAHPKASRIIQAAGECEVSALWTVNGTLCKGRFDRLIRAGELLNVPVILELKSTRDPLPWHFASDVEKFGYDLQASWYCEGHSIITGVSPQHIIIAVQNEGPFDVMVYIGENVPMAEARATNQKLFEQYCQCVATGKWPGYSNEIQPLGRAFEERRKLRTS
jgi:hypothetical protein